MARPSQELNHERLINPQAGDYWHERFIIYFAVMEVLPTGNLIIIETKQTPQGQDLVEETAKEITPEQMREQVMYRGMQNFVADVVVGNPAIAQLVESWVAKGKPYAPYVPPDELAEIPAWVEPKWGRCHAGEWQFYINRPLREMWPTLSKDMKLALWVNATQIAKGNFPDNHWPEA